MDPMAISRWQRRQGCCRHHNGQSPHAHSRQRKHSIRLHEPCPPLTHRHEAHEARRCIWVQHSACGHVGTNMCSRTYKHTHTQSLRPMTDSESSVSPDPRGEPLPLRMGHSAQGLVHRGPQQRVLDPIHTTHWFQHTLKHTGVVLL